MSSSSEFRHDELCYARPLLSITHLDRLVAVQNENDELRAKLVVLEDDNSTLMKTVEELSANQAAHLEAINLQADQFRACQLHIVALDQELKQCESQRSQLAAQNSSQTVRILDLEKSITSLTGDLLSADAQQQVTSRRLADMARELSTLQQRFTIQKESNDQLERQLVTIRELGNAKPPAPHLPSPTRKSLDDPIQTSTFEQCVGKDEKKEQRESHMRENSYDVATHLESDLLQKSKLRDLAQSQLQHLENQKLRTIAEKARKDAISHEVTILNSEFSDIRKQLRAMNQLVK
ncbi:Hypothetical protein, putative [Bodo saltans]|uniref:Uncharacterized protein n=1 Tax=Bodo saltans TaxID=75058 RepID=A0A0S4IWS6_BODSA|nr:Hypothetical protein, putative [Bodo saltans]|eukprot:CUG30789.1 Hypothetical protein, putative [Bodo saltans]